MFKSNRYLILLFPLLAASAVLAGCSGSNRTSIDGKELWQFTGARLFLMLPTAEALRFENPKEFAWSRGTSEVAIASKFAAELHSKLTVALDSRLDSNSILDFSAQSVGLTNRMTSDVDFSGHESGWNWEKITRVGQLGSIDYLIVLRNVVIGNDKPDEPNLRGTERVSAQVLLVSIAESKVLDSQIASVEIEDPRKPNDTFLSLARAVAGSLPFQNSDK